MHSRRTLVSPVVALAFHAVMLLVWLPARAAQARPGEHSQMHLSIPLRTQALSLSPNLLKGLTCRMLATLTAKVLSGGNASGW